MIKLTCIGHLGKDATKNEVNGKTVINFSVAHSETFTQNGEKKTKTTWVDCSYWVDKTGILPYLTKGAQVYVEGQPDVRSYTTQNGNGASLTCRVFSVQLLGSKQDMGATANGTQQQANSSPQQTSQSADIQEVADDLPF